MKRILRLTLILPLIGLMLVLMTIAYPLHRFVWWLFEDRPYDGGGVSDLWSEAWRELWG